MELEKYNGFYIISEVDFKNLLEENVKGDVRLIKVNSKDIFYKFRRRVCHNLEFSLNKSILENNDLRGRNYEILKRFNFCIFDPDLYQEVILVKYDMTGHSSIYVDSSCYLTDEQLIELIFKFVGHYLPGIHGLNFDNEDFGLRNTYIELPDSILKLIISRFVPGNTNNILYYPKKVIYHSNRVSLVSHNNSIIYSDDKLKLGLDDVPNLYYFNYYIFNKIRK